MKTEIVKASEMKDGKRVPVGEGNLEIMETVEDILQGIDNKLFTEAEVVVLFNASRRIEFQRQLKAKDTTKVKDKVLVSKLLQAAKSNPELEKQLRDAGVID